MKLKEVLKQHDVVVRYLTFGILTTFVGWFAYFGILFGGKAIYGLPPEALDILDECITGGVERMRNFQRRLVERGVPLKAYPFTKIIDIDHAEDIAKAEKFLAEK